MQFAPSATVSGPVLALATSIASTSEATSPVAPEQAAGITAAGAVAGQVVRAMVHTHSAAPSRLVLPTHANVSEAREPRHSSPEDDVDLAARREAGGGLGHDDVAVGRREDREERRAAEERLGLVAGEPHLDHVEAPRRGREVAPEAGAHPWLWGRLSTAADGADDRHPNQPEHHQRGAWVPRQP